MQYSDDRFHLNVQLDCKDCQIPADERSRMQESLVYLGEQVEEYPASDLKARIVYHPQSQTYHVELHLQVPGRKLISAQTDPYLDSAFQRSLDELRKAVDEYNRSPDQEAINALKQRLGLQRDVVAPEPPEPGPLAQAVEQADYAAFRAALAPFDTWLNDRVGRWLSRNPAVEAEVGKTIRPSEVVEEVYLNAFEVFPKRPADLAFHQWLQTLIDPSIKRLLQHPDQEKQNISMAETLQETQ